ncbi:response regulator PleD [Planctomycetes bacterium Pla163]|uniref:Response regulator PleD n=1 Tax=Rohdeia mirabilis TaxID=2528008 RepID=A0A518CWY4_9BACT|nr:response regulator PleD [Planctomycetes bacterium Pla163]
MSELDQIPIKTPPGSLFNAAELERLLEAEVDRARRYDYSLCCVLIAVDRLEALTDLHGSSAHDEIYGAVERFLRRDLRTSDFIGTLMGDRLLAVIPSTSRDGVVDVVRRLLVGVRKLEFTSGDRQLRVTLSVGLTWAPGSELNGFKRLLGAAQGALGAALGSGGDRYVEGAFAKFEEAPAAAPTPAPEAAPAPAAVAPAPVDATAGLDPEDLLAAVRHVLGEHAQAVARMEDAQSRPSGENSDQVKLLERRVQKLAGELERYQQVVASLIEEGGSRDDGVASLGKIFGGIGQGKDDEKRKHMMGDIFQANLALKQALTESSEGGN